MRTDRHEQDEGHAEAEDPQGHREARARDGFREARARAHQQPAQVRAQVLLAQAADQGHRGALALRRRPDEEAARSLTATPEREDRSSHVARVKRAVNAQKKRRTTLEAASGYRGQRSRLYRKAKEQILHSATYNYRDRKVRKGDFRKLWITRINAAARQNDMTYNRFMQGLKLAGIELDRRVLAELAVNEPAAFAALVETSRAAVAAAPAPEKAA